jgi:hypothetical protein
MKIEKYYCTECKKEHFKHEDEELYENHQVNMAVNSTDKKHLNLNDLILSTRDCIEEEFDMLEIIEDEIESIFSCNMDCKTCTAEEQGECFARWRKTNLYWLRKIAQDEYILKDIVMKMDELREFITEMYRQVREQMKNVIDLKPIEEFDVKVDAREDIKEKKEDLGYFQ